MGVRRCLARSLTSLAFRCALQRVQTVPAAIHSGRIPPSRQPPTGTEDSAIPLTTPDMVRSGRVLLTSVKSPLCELPLIIQTPYLPGNNKVYKKAF